jgi:hypothetical protein
MIATSADDQHTAGHRIDPGQLYLSHPVRLETGIGTTLPRVSQEASRLSIGQFSGNLNYRPRSLAQEPWPSIKSVLKYIEIRRINRMAMGSSVLVILGLADGFHQLP